MSAEPTITCPTCRAEIRLTESLAAPLIATTRERYEKLLAQQRDSVVKREQEITEREERLAKDRETLDAAVAEKVKAEREKLASEAAKREQAFKAREEQLAREKESLDAAVAEKLSAERVKIAADEAKKAKLLLSNDLEQKSKEVADLQEVLKQRDEKLAEAQNARAEFMKKQRELDDARREMEVTIEKRIADSLGKTREQAQREIEEQHRLVMEAKDKVIEDQKRQLAEAQRKLEQGSQQTQGEVLEMELESILKRQFPFDLIEPVPTGTRGADVYQHVRNERGQTCGMILWESKNTKAWKDEFISKLLANGRACKADVCALLTVTLPKDVCNFADVQGVWVTNRDCVIGVASCLRSMLIELGAAKRFIEGQTGKMERVYHYLTSSDFRDHMKAVVDSFKVMRADIEKERMSMANHWKKREKQLDLARDSAMSVHGSIMAIAGADLTPIEGLELESLSQGDMTTRLLG